MAQTATIVAPKIYQNLTSSMVAIGSYSPAASTAAIVTSLILTNKTSSQVTVKVSIYNGATDTYLAFDAPIGPNDSIDIAKRGALTLITGWSIRVSCPAASAVDAVMNVTELT